jgi:hypothetical protein
MYLSKTVRRLRSVKTPQITWISQFGSRFINVQVRRMSHVASQLECVDVERPPGRATGAPDVRAADESGQRRAGGEVHAR